MCGPGRHFWTSSRLWGPSAVLVGAQAVYEYTRNVDEEFAVSPGSYSERPRRRGPRWLCYVSPPPTFDTGVPVSIEAAVRAVTTLAIPQPWEFDIPNRIINEWYSLHMSPPEYREPLYSYFNGVSVQTSYSTEHNEVSVLFQKRMPTEEE